jgi:diguanylate cyclase (GGDEF)-like protein
VLAAPVPVGEARRVAALRALRILDTLPEERFDRICRLASRIFAAPMVLISLVDEQREWIKSHHGMEPLELPRHLSFGAHVILEDGSLVVSDCAKDPRFADHPLVRGVPRIQACAAHPLHAADGSKIGALFVFDLHPREFSANELASLTDLAAMVDSELALQAQSPEDELTGLANRRGFMAVAEHLLASCRRGGRPATLIAIDLDGHDGGDETLRSFAEMLYQHFRASDVVARLGNDEFAVLCSGASTAQIGQSLKRLREAFNRSAMVERNSELTWNAGSAEFHPALDADIHALMRVAGARKHSAREQARFARDLADL